MTAIETREFFENQLKGHSKFLFANIAEDPGYIPNEKIVIHMSKMCNACQNMINRLIKEHGIEYKVEIRV